MSRRLTALTPPSNKRWEDIIVVAEGSEVAGYSVTLSDFAKARRLKVAIEQIYGRSLEEFIAAYNGSKVVLLKYLKMENPSYKSFISSSTNQAFLQSIIKRAYRLAEGMSSMKYLPTRDISRYFNYERKD